MIPLFGTDGFLSGEDDVIGTSDDEFVWMEDVDDDEDGLRDKLLLPEMS